MNYSTTSQLTREVCQKLGIDFQIHFVKTARRKGKIYVSATCGKPGEWRYLERECDANGYFYTGRTTF